MAEPVGLDVLVDAPEKLPHALVSGGDRGGQVSGEPHPVTVDREHPACHGEPVGLQGGQVEPPVIGPADHLGGWLVPREQAVGHLIDRRVEKAEAVQPPGRCPCRGSCEACGCVGRRRSSRLVRPPGVVGELGTGRGGADH